MNCFNTGKNCISLTKKPLIKVQRYNTNSITNPNINYSTALVKKHDYENFICTLLLKGSLRTSAFAVRSFNVEISKIAEQTSQPSLALMRMKFWEDAINNCYSKNINKVPKQPVALELFKAITASNLTKRYFNNLIKGRRDYFLNNTFPDVETLEKYFEYSISNVYYLILEACNVRNVSADHAASHLGKAQGLVQQLRSTTVAKKLNLITLPQTILIKYNVSHEEIFRGKSSDRLSDCTYEVASQAHYHLKKCRDILKSVPLEARSVLLPAVTVENYLNNLHKANYDVFHPNLQRRTWIWMPKLWYKNFVCKY
ncbi:hypothetical protein FQA39_LY03850 [Lamprigera yunnana]|nr:hypothetical protein FQA39_LY03850 [Lamprigera yunnana]